jgi:hypothetical protein
VLVHSIPDPLDRPTLTVPEAGKIAFDLGYAASYEAAKRGDLPIIRCGRRMYVPTAALRQMLGIDPVEVPSA